LAASTGEKVTRKWNLDETYVKVKGAWFPLYRAIDNYYDTVEFYRKPRSPSFEALSAQGSGAPWPAGADHH